MYGARGDLDNMADDLLSNPNVRKFFDLTSFTEGTYGRGDQGYNIGFGGQTFDSYAAHPNMRKTFKQTDGKTNVTTAAGKYQITKTTYDDIAPKLGITDFSPESQDRIALELMRRSGALDKVLAGDFQGAIAKASGTWASFPGSPYPQPTVAQKRIDKFLASGETSAPPPKGSLEFNTSQGTLNVTPSSQQEADMLQYIAMQPPQKQESMLNLGAWASAPVDDTEAAYIFPELMRQRILEVVRRV